MHLFGYVSTVKLVEHIFERGNFIAVHQGVDVVVQHDIAHAMARKEVFNQMARLQIIAAQSAQVFCDDQIDLSFFRVSQKALQTGPVHIQAGKAVILVYINSIPPLCFAHRGEQLALIADAGGFSLQVVVLGQPAINARFEQAHSRERRAAACRRSVHHPFSPHNPDEP